MNYGIAITIFVLIMLRSDLMRKNPINTNNSATVKRISYYVAILRHSYVFKHQNGNRVKIVYKLIQIIDKITIGTSLLTEK